MSISFVSLMDEVFRSENFVTLITLQENHRCWTRPRPGELTDYLLCSIQD